MSLPIILVVDDDEATRNMLALHLEKWGYLVVEARDGQEAWDCLVRRAYSFYAVITDHQMPRMDGTDLLRRIRDEKVSVSRLILNSGFEPALDVQDELAEMGTAILLKPYPFELLRDLLEVSSEIIS